VRRDGERGRKPVRFLLHARIIQKNIYKKRGNEEEEERDDV
jgi:hypothetical protein